MSVDRVQPGTAAEEAGLRMGDLILAIDGEAVDDQPRAPQFRELIQSKGAGGVIRLDVLRGDERLQLEATLGARRTRRWPGL